MIAFLVLTAVTFSLFGFIIGLWAEGFEKLQIIPLLVLTPLTFLGGSFYSINVLPPFWQTVSLFNPIVYLISGFRWSFYEVSDVSVTVSIVMIAVFLAVCLAIVAGSSRPATRSRSSFQLRHLDPRQHRQRHDRDQHRDDPGRRQARALDQRPGDNRRQHRHRSRRRFR